MMIDITLRRLILQSICITLLNIRYILRTNHYTIHIEIVYGDLYCCEADILKGDYIICQGELLVYNGFYRLVTVTKNILIVSLRSHVHFIHIFCNFSNSCCGSRHRYRFRLRDFYFRMIF